MGALQSIPFCSREKQQKPEEVPPLQLDSNNNEAVVDQPAAVTASSGSDPVATSTPRQRSGSGVEPELAEELTVDDGLELSSGFENPHFGSAAAISKADCEDEQPSKQADEEEDDIGPVVDQVIGGSSSDEDEGREVEGDSGLALQEFRKRHNLDGPMSNDIDTLRRQAMTPPPPECHDLYLDDDQFEDLLDDDIEGDDDDDDETLHVPDVDSRDLSSSEDPVERPPEPRVPEEKRLSPSSGSSDEETTQTETAGQQYFSKAHDPTTDAISNMLSDIVGADRPHPDMSTHIVSRQ